VREQVPPPYSAVKHRGKPLYKWARQGINIDLPPRLIEIYSLSLEEVALPYVTFSLACSKGTYIRSLCQEIGVMLNCGACLAALRRTRCGSYSEKDAVALSGLEEKGQKELLSAHLVSLAEALPDLPVMQVDKPLADKIRQGYQPVVDDLLPYHIPFLAAGDVLRITQRLELVAIARMLRGSVDLPPLGGQEQAVEILRVFNGQ
jgi:tRNA pseudouridine55 synthase